MFRRSLIIIFVLLALPVAAATWVLAPVFTATKPGEEAPPSAKPAEATGPTDVAKLPDLSALAPRTPTAEPARFDVARIDPNGWSVFAGTAPANASVTVTADGVTVGTAKADENGEWSLSADHRFASAKPVLALATRVGDPAPAEPVANKRPVAETPSSVTASPKADAKPAKVALADKPAVTPETPRASAASAPQISAAEATKGMMQKLENLVAAARVEETATPQAPAAPKAEQQPVATAAPESPRAASTAPAQPTTQATAAVKSEPQAPAQVAASIATPVATPAPAASSAPSRLSSQPAAKPVPVPVPMQFVFREATFTEDGRRAADLLVEYLRLKKPAAITMTGHADERGSDSFNLDLSRERLETVAQYLRENGYSGTLTLNAKGRSEPYAGVERKLYSRDALYQLDRRVEVLLDSGQPARAAGTASSEASSATRN
jgi:outer membrane protein OmpA-like peptidoglycan-associated protein